ncbi:hypothetical protein [Edaphobacter albus]|uniref:hypothetical protein n=1 Tax=Edaphobacter sp. 4G125 TaxID=2763071 RepID=UPI001647DDDF|nr:hypothetical protein [Edaphobacter sp. 4G125]QNI37496.1 hypothetical protein H7846_04120 [Edaphobacter sp. 4G125]
MVIPSLEPSSTEAKLKYWRELARAYEDSETRYLYQVAELEEEVGDLREQLAGAHRIIDHLRKRVRQQAA